MTGKIFRCAMIVTVAVLLCSLGIIAWFLYSHLPAGELALLAEALVPELFFPAVGVGIAATVVALLLARCTTKKIVEPLNRIDLERPLENEACEELVPLLHRVNQQYIEISSHLRILRRKTGEFEQIIRHMKEGLVLLDSETTILSINPAAKALFGADNFCVGKSFLTVERSQQMREAVNAALDKGHGAVKLMRNGREYQFDLSRIESDGYMAGVVVLAIDVTDEVNAEQNRREFSANVSHELKTPLQSIIGSAELLENGLIKSEDIPRFVGHIRKEAARLVVLVEDIIRLSQLDEGAQMPTEEVELLSLAQEVVAELDTAAQSRDVSVAVTGENCSITGVRRLLSEILYNLCENAIKYNVPGGSVTVDIRARDHHATVTVSDTGIGIPAEHQARVFERFYRVDKSHSKQSGGTGLGLSIVKHAVQYHNAKLTLVSEPGKGTTITVIF